MHFFKALLFLGSGSVILGLEHGLHHMEHDPHLKKKLKGHASDRAAHSGHFDPQDMRNMGGLRSKMKVTFVVYLAGALALAGIFPFSGFWSKDEILAESIHLQPTAFYLLVIAAFFTAFYMGRQVFMVFFGKPRSPVVEHTHESPAIITVPLMILASLAILAGLLNLPKVYTFTTWLEHTYDKIHPGEFVLWLALLASALSLLGIGIAWWLYMRRYPTMEKLPAAKRPDDPLRPMLQPLTLVTFFPLVGVLVILFLKQEQKNLIRWTALSLRWLPSASRCGCWPSSTRQPDLQMTINLPWITFGGWIINLAMGWTV
jgi:NADH-quinone oxidoreductase subunit L